MFDFLETARGIQVLYKYIKLEILESDFYYLPSEDYKKLPKSEPGKKWYMINPAKLKQQYMDETSAFIVDEHEKLILLKAVNFIKSASNDLPVNASFLERLLYVKKFVPSCFFSSEEQASNKNADVIQLDEYKKDKQ